ncbi:MAG: hypothetical protein QM796_16665 [Chthoniobacteraceae bacterium]
MNGWDNDEETLDETQAYHRRRIIRALRGWLYEHSRPRTLTACLLAISLAVGNTTAACLPWHGLWTPAVWALEAVAIAWPVFMVLLHWQMRLAFANFNATGDIAKLLETDRQQQTGFTGDDSIENATGIAALAGGGCVGIVAYFALSGIGIVLIDLVRESPTTLSEMYLDGELTAKHPELFGSIRQEDWRSNLITGTVFQFFITALTASVLSMIAAWIILDPRGAVEFIYTRHRWGW